MPDAAAVPLPVGHRSPRPGVGVLRRLLRHPSAALGAAVLVLSVGAAVAAPLLAPADPNHGILADRLAPPGHVGTTGMTYLLGADQIGRDILSRILHGARVSLAVGALTTLLSMLAGLALGTVAGFFRGPFDGALSRFADVLMAFPYLIFAIGAMAVMGPGFGNLVMALAFKGWVEFYRLARGETLVQTTREYVEGARAVGASAARIIRRHIVPNIVHTSLVLATLRMGYFIVLEASLSFLGLGLPPRIPAWGSMVADGREVMLTAWWVSTLPGLAIVVVVLAVNLFGEGVRDILDPRLKVD
jgi:peptide/nickel transport system permease protein